MKPQDESQTIQLDEILVEKELRSHLKSNDPGRNDFSEDFFNQLHDKIMAQIEDTEILPGPLANPKERKPSFRWKQWWTRNIVRRGPPMMLALLVVLCSQNLQKTGDFMSSSDLVAQEALRSPELFESMVSSSLGQSDFLVDVASSTFDHLNLNDFETLFEKHSALQETR